MENAVDIEQAEKLQVENLLLKNRLALAEIANQQSVIADVGRALNTTIGALRSKYKLDTSWRLDVESFKFIKVEQPPEMGLPVKVPMEPEGPEAVS